MVIHLVSTVLGAVAGQTQGLVRRELVDRGVDTSSNGDAGVSGSAGKKGHGGQKRNGALWHCS